jgi:hypothetical protein
MTVRRLVVAAIVMIGAVVGSAPTANASRIACAWVTPYGVCVNL